MPTLILRSIGVTMLAAALFTGCSYSPTSVKAAVKPDKERKLAPNFALKNASGQTVKLSDYRGKVVLLNFWATWCGPCKVEIPWFIDFEQTYKDKNFTMLGVSMDDDGWKGGNPLPDRTQNSIIRWSSAVKRYPSNTVASKLSQPRL